MKYYNPNYLLYSNNEDSIDFFQTNINEPLNELDDVNTLLKRHFDNENKRKKEKIDYTIFK